MTTTRQTAPHAGLYYVLWTNPKEACTRPPMSTWGPPRVPSNKLELIRGRTWPPCFPMVRDWRLGIASPSSQVSETVRYPLDFPTEPGQYEWGLGKPQRHLKAVFMDYATSPPVTAIKPLGSVLGELPALTPTGIQSSREHFRREGVKSVRSCTPASADVQTVCKSRRESKIRRMG